MCDVCCRYINELIECLLIAKTERERLRKEKADELARQRIPDPIPRKIPSQPGLKMESKLGTSNADPLQKNKEKISKTVDDVGASTQSHLPHDLWETLKEVTFRTCWCLKSCEFFSNRFSEG